MVEVLVRVVKTGVIFLTIFFIIFGLSTDGAAKRPATVSIGEGETKVELIEGFAQVMRVGTKDWISLKPGDSLENGDQVHTGVNSRIELALPDSTVLRFADNTRFRIVRIDVSGETRQRNIKVDITLGRTWANVRSVLGLKSDIELSCENAVTGVRGTIYRMNVYEDKSALVRVYDGNVYVTSGGEKKTDVPGEMTHPYKIAGPHKVPGPRKVTVEEWTYIIRSMQQIRIRADGWAEQPRGFTDQEDMNEWVEWNKKRDDFVSGN